MRARIPTQRLQSVYSQPRSGDNFGQSISLYENFLVVGCPGREDTWLHTGKVATDWEGEDVGGVYLYRRDSAEKAFSFFQVRRREAYSSFKFSSSITGIVFVVVRTSCSWATSTRSMPTPSLLQTSFSDGHSTFSRVWPSKNTVGI